MDLVTLGGFVNPSLHINARNHGRWGGSREQQPNLNDSITKPNPDDSLSSPSHEDSITQPNPDDSLAHPSHEDSLVQPILVNSLAHPSPEDSLVQPSYVSSLAQPNHEESFVQPSLVSSFAQVKEKTEEAFLFLRPDPMTRAYVFSPYSVPLQSTLEECTNPAGTGSFSNGRLQSNSYKEVFQMLAERYLERRHELTRELEKLKRICVGSRFAPRQCVLSGQ